MKTLLLMFTLCFSSAGKVDALYLYNWCPSPVTAFSGDASQCCPFEGWGLNSLYTYSYYYYPDLASRARYLRYQCGYSSYFVKCWLQGCMCATWKNA